MAELLRQTVIDDYGLVIQTHPLDHNQKVNRRIEYSPCTIADIVKTWVPEGGYVAVGFNGQIIEAENWPSCWVKPGDTVIIVPQIGGGSTKQYLSVAAILVLTYFAGPVGTSIGSSLFGAGTTAAGLAGAAATTAIIVGGGMLINSAFRPDDLSQPQLSSDIDLTTRAQWASQTTQQAGSSVHVVYGQIIERGNVLMAHTTNTNTDVAVPAADLWWVSNLLTYPPVYRTDSTQKYNLLISLGDGPNEGIVSGTVKLNGRDLDNYPGVTTEEKKGTLGQSQISLWSDHRIQFSPNYQLEEGTPYTWTTPDANYQKLNFEFVFPNGLCGFTSRGDKTYVKANLKIEISEADADLWSTLVDETVAGKNTTPIRYDYASDETYTLGAAVTISVGTQYDVRFTLVSTDDLDSKSPRLDCYVSAVREILTDTFAYPRTGLYAIQAVEADELSGYIKFEAEYKGKIVFNVLASAWAWSDNPADVLLDILTQPVLSGSAGSWKLQRYDGKQLSSFVPSDFTDLAEYCNELVSDGKGGTEKRFTFNGIFPREQTLWDSAAVVLAMCNSKIVPIGDTYRIIIDRAVEPVYEFTIGNMLQDSFEMIGLERSQRASVIQMDYMDRAQNYKIQPLRVGFESAGNIKNKIRWSGHGITSQTQAERTANRLLYSNAYLKKLYAWSADLDAIACEVGDVVYLTHDAISETNQGGAVLSAGTNWVEVDRALTEVSGSGILIVTAYDSVNQRDVVLERGVTEVSGSTIKIDGTFPTTQMPAKTSKYVYGPTTVSSEKVRILSFESDRDMRIRITAIQYDERVYDSDSGDPVVPVDTSLSRPTTNRWQDIDPPKWKDITKQVAPNDIQVVSNSETIDVTDMSFTGNSVDTIMWTAQLGTAAGIITYKGSQYFIQADAVGTTDEYVYWDVNGADPTELETTNDKTTWQVDGRFLMARNNDGVSVTINGVKTQSSNETSLSIGTNWRLREVGDDCWLEVLIGAVWTKQRVFTRPI